MSDPVDIEAGEDAAPRPVDEPEPDAIADLDGQLRRALADLENLRKRYHRELARERAAERALVATELLPVLDNLERAIEHADSESTSVVEGVRAVRDQAVAALARLGYPRFEPVGQQFDATRHEALSAVEDDDAAPGTIVATVRPGYGSEGAILRPAGVVVSRGSG
jgi:molecular chaperone GrpE